MVEEYKLTEEGLRYVRKLLKENEEARNFFFGLITNDVIKFIYDNLDDPVKIILKILEADTRLRMEGLDWEQFLVKLKRTGKGYVVKGDDSDV
ncbi:hypothetical protein DRO97_07570 [Archaeoglobales archaeon]|nr:MAG: hypothetical protein DRO97_07570 [Archaeoglobales archaeon]